MVDTDLDKAVRQKVSEIFSSNVQNATVVDFGGGTGLDLKWLAENNKKVFFCEPSKAMREIAISTFKKAAQGHVVFLQENATDFREWQTNPPFVEKADALLANFAVLNCIPNIELFFHNVALHIMDGGNVFALILTKNFRRRLFSNFKSSLQSLIFKQPLSINLQYQNHQQTVYIYSIKEIIKASKNNFILYSSESTASSEFTLIHLIRK